MEYMWISFLTIIVYTIAKEIYLIVKDYYDKKITRKEVFSKFFVEVLFVVPAAIYLIVFNAYQWGQVRLFPNIMERLNIIHKSTIREFEYINYSYLILIAYAVISLFIASRYLLRQYDDNGVKGPRFDFALTVLSSAFYSSLILFMFVILMSLPLKDGVSIELEVPLGTKAIVVSGERVYTDLGLDVTPKDTPLGYLNKIVKISGNSGGVSFELTGEEEVLTFNERMNLIFNFNKRSELTIVPTEAPECIELCQ